MTGSAAEHDRELAEQTAGTEGSATGEPAAGAVQAAPGEAHDSEATDGERFEQTTSAAAKLPKTLTFRITPVTLVVIVTVAVCISPLAASLPWFSVLYAVPLALAVWVLRVRTVVSGEGLKVRGVASTTHVRWDEIQALRLDEKRWVRAVTQSGKEVRLPAVRVRDLSRLAVMSNGHLSDPAVDEQPSE